MQHTTHQEKPGSRHSDRVMSFDANTAAVVAFRAFNKTLIKMELPESLRETANATLIGKLFPGISTKAIKRDGQIVNVPVVSDAGPAGTLETLEDVTKALMSAVDILKSDDRFHQRLPTLSTAEHDTLQAVREASKTTNGAVR